MSKKNRFYILALLLFFSLAAIGMPSAVLAEENNVTDWVEDKQPAGAEKEENAEVQPTEDPSLAGSVVRLVFYLALILGMIYGLIKFLALKQQKTQPNQAVKLMGGTPLGNNKSLQLVKVGEKVLLIGVGEQVTLIKEFSGADEIGVIEKDFERQATPFSNPLSKLPLWKKAGSQYREPLNGGFEKLFAQSLTKQKLKQEQVQQDLSNKADKKEGSSK